MSSLFIISILFFSALFSGLAIFFVKRDNTSILKLILSFSGAYLFAITVLHLIPHVYLEAGSEDMEMLGLYVLGGFIFQIILEQFSHGIEHGHVHHKTEGASIFPLGIMISLCVHAFIEGMPLASEHQNQLVFGIAIHHIPAAFALASLLINTRISRLNITLLLILFASMTPLGYLVSNWLSTAQIGNIEQHFPKLMAIVVGIFLHISTTILFESGSENHHHFNKKKMVAVAIGLCIALANFFLWPHDHSGHSHGHGHGHEHHDHGHDDHDHSHDHNHDHDDHQH